MFGQHINECLRMESNKEEQLISRNSQGNDSRGEGGTDDTSGKAVAKLSQANPGEIQIQRKYKQV